LNINLVLTILSLIAGSLVWLIRIVVNISNRLITIELKQTVMQEKILAIDRMLEKLRDEK
jgi:hypothetical protein